ncbi:MAG: hypothetical protein V7K97_04920 [Nostoc sp.]|uniref:hypothetical protein n=1 Tax=Nostoc sp. TaxID=1180 RepID=UPI002FF7ADA3
MVFAHVAACPIVYTRRIDLSVMKVLLACNPNVEGSRIVIRIWGGGGCGKIKLGV